MKAIIDVRAAPRFAYTRDSGGKIVRKMQRLFAASGGVLRGTVLTALLAGSGSAAAHHSFAVHFVADRLVTVAGVVDEFTFRNPHGVLRLSVKDADGGTQQWKIETNSPNILRRRGWTETSIKPGDAVTVEGYPARDGSNFMRVYRVVYADGRELVGQRPDPTVISGED